MGQHWYDEDGNPMYTIVGANGAERDTTLRDARKYNLSPSTTTVMAGAAKPALAPYIEKQLLDAVEKIGTTRPNWRWDVVKKSKEHASNAAAKGTKIHDALEQYYLTGKIKRGNSPLVKGTQVIDYQDGLPICENVYYTWKEALTPIIDLLKSEFGDIKWTPERSFTSKLGFGGKVDMSYNDGMTQIVLDFKTKDTDDIKKMVAYDEHGMQTASYAVGLDMPEARRYNLFISTQTLGLMNLTESTDFERDWGMFEALLKLWQLKNKYVPGA